MIDSDVHKTISQLQLSKHIVPTESYHLNVPEYRMTRMTTFGVITLLPITRVCNSTH